MGARLVGVEEELLIVDPQEGCALPLAPRLLKRAAPAGTLAGSAASLTGEYKQEQVEINTAPCSSAGDLWEQVLAGRTLADSAAREFGARILAAATASRHTRPNTSPGNRYAAIDGQFGLIAQEQLTCGLHIHVSIDSPEEGAAVLDRIRCWLPLVLALSANSPFWDSNDTGYASYRTQIWSRWPSSGPQELFGSASGYRAAVAELMDSGVLLDEGMVYFDARLSRRHPTVEIRIADVCLRPADTVTLALLVRALVATAAQEWRRGIPPPAASARMLRVANWCASRFGINADLLHPLDGRPYPAAGPVQALLDHTADALSLSGDTDSAIAGIGRILRLGSGERLQRQAFLASGSLAGSVAAAVTATLEGTWPAPPN